MRNPAKNEENCERLSVRIQRIMKENTKVYKMKTSFLKHGDIKIERR